MWFLLIHDLVYDGRRPAARAWNLVIYNVQLLNKAGKRHTKYDIISDARTLGSNAELVNRLERMLQELLWSSPSLPSYNIILFLVWYICALTERYCLQKNGSAFCKIVPLRMSLFLFYTDFIRLWS